MTVAAVPPLFLDAGSLQEVEPRADFRGARETRLLWMDVEMARIFDHRTCAAFFCYLKLLTGFTSWKLRRFSSGNLTRAFIQKCQGSRGHWVVNMVGWHGWFRQLPRGTYWNLEALHIFPDCIFFHHSEGKNTTLTNKGTFLFPELTVFVDDPTRTSEVRFWGPDFLRDRG